MKKEFADYLDSVGLVTEESKKQVEAILETVQKITDEEVQDVFVSETGKKEGTWVYQSLWCFTPSRVLEARGFRSSTDIDCVCLDPSLYLRFLAQAYIFGHATMGSRLEVDAEIASGVYFELRGTDMNCDNLLRVVQKYFLIHQGTTNAGT